MGCQRSRYQDNEVSSYLDIELSESTGVNRTKGTQSFTGLLYYLSYQYVRRLAYFGFSSRFPQHLGDTSSSSNSLSNMTFEKL